VTDADGDGYGVGVAEGPDCVAPGVDYALEAAGEDCRDDNMNINPGADEVCNGFDDDCDELIDDLDDSLDPDSTTTWYLDDDRDGFGDEDIFQETCDRPDRHVADDTDCNDGDRFINPDATEICDGGIDNDCDTYVDDADDDVDEDSFQLWYADLDGDGYGDPGDPLLSCSQPDLYVDNDEDCDDTNPYLGPPSRWLMDEDEDGFGAGTPSPDLECLPPIEGMAPESAGIDCLPLDPDSHPGAVEICGDGVDQDCVGGDLSCGPPLSCKDALSRDALAPTGIYEIAPDGITPYDVVCDMVVDEGGWTLVASSSLPFDDAASLYSDNLQDLGPLTPMEGVWDGMRPIASGDADVRFTCKDSPGDFAYRVDLSFYEIHWYQEVTTGLDFQSCFSENEGAGADLPPPARRNNVTGSSRALGDDWDAEGFLEGENTCSATGDFTIDFDDRGVDGNPSDGTDWGEASGTQKCGLAGSGSAWFMWVRER
jgi:hypothetical protein